MKFSEATSATIDEIETQLELELSPLPTLEAALQRSCEVLFERFHEAAVLVRAFATMPYGRLPGSCRAFADEIVTRGEPGRALAPGAPVIALLGTRGELPGWNSRHLSHGHVAIPLASEDFLRSMPMVARLLKQLGAEPAALRSLDTSHVTQSLGSAAGVFYVEDARRDVDTQGRPVIAARDFVEAHDVRTVFGFGGAYAVAGTFLVVVVFTRESVALRTVERFMRLSNVIKAATMRSALEGRLFDDAPPPARRRRGARTAAG